jgi:RNA polymerase sigma-70 factor (ECF subfamily)
MDQSDVECIKQCLNGHPETFGELVEKHQAPLLSWLCARLRNAGKAEEVAQEAFVRSFFHLRKLRKPESYRSWLFGIADRVVKETHRSGRRELTLVDPSRHAAKDPATGADPEIVLAVSQLPEPYRQVIELRFYGGLSCAEVAEHLDAQLGTVTMRLSRAYSMLRQSLGRSGT